ncbi:carbohydrate kinase family protein [Paenibacillus senegalensis]|uniref:carbohydrate kinase family protein n=1 Tax=Paenibacillus senegalensis TaxID=1465766 RepID=UPI000288F7D2|nr:carbohydrate kinase family protein [Paenibacillus senegalensis]
MNKTVFIIGELNPDVILSGPDVKPEPNKEKWVEQFEVTLGSSSAITASVLSRLGADVQFVSIVGNDEYGAFCVEKLRHYGVGTEYVIFTDKEKTGITFSLSTPEDRSLLTYKGTIPLLEPGMIPVEQILKEADHLHFGSFYLQENMKQHWLELFRLAHTNGISTSFDTGYDPSENWDRAIISSLLTYTDYFIPSETELEHIFSTADLDRLPAELPAQRGLIAVKRGSMGASLLDSEGEWLHSEAFRISPVDTTGAGDSFNAGLLYSALNGNTPAQCLRFASACGALATLRIGGVSERLPSAEEVINFIRRQGLSL